MLTIRHLATGLYRRSYLANFAHQAYCIYKTNEPDKPHEPYAPLLQKHTKLPPFGRAGVGVGWSAVGCRVVWIGFYVAYKLTCTPTTASLGRSPYQPVDCTTPLYVVTA